MTASVGEQFGPLKIIPISPSSSCCHLRMALSSCSLLLHLPSPSHFYLSLCPAGFCSRERLQGGLLKEYCQTVALQLYHTHTQTHTHTHTHTHARTHRRTDLQLRCQAVARGLQAGALNVQSITFNAPVGDTL